MHDRWRPNPLSFSFLLHHTSCVSRADGESDSGWGEEERGVGGTTVVEIEKKVVAKPGV
jgi:hypothetical protein